MVIGQIHGPAGIAWCGGRLLRALATYDDCWVLRMVANALQLPAHNTQAQVADMTKSGGITSFQHARAPYLRTVSADPVGNRPYYAEACACPYDAPAPWACTSGSVRASMTTTSAASEAACAQHRLYAPARHMPLRARITGCDAEAMTLKQSRAAAVHTRAHLVIVCVRINTQGPGEGKNLCTRHSTTIARVLMASTQ